jgi:hypothetical protein
MAPARLAMLYVDNVESMAAALNLRRGGKPGGG